MMDAAIDTVDDGIGLALQLVMQATVDQPPEDGFGRFGLDREVGKWPLGPGHHRPVHGLDDVATCGEFAQRVFDARLQRPDSRSQFVRDTQTLQRLGSADQPSAHFGVSRFRRSGSQIGDPCIVVGKAAQGLVKAGPALGLHLGVEPGGDLTRRPWPKF